MGGKRRSQDEILADLKAKTAAIEAKQALRAKLENDSFAAQCNRAKNLLRRIVEEADPLAYPRLAARCELAITELGAVLEPVECEDAAGAPAE